MNLQAILSRRLAAGHSGQYRTARRSEIRLSNMARYSASLEFLVVFPFPELINVNVRDAMTPVEQLFYRCVKNKTIVLAAFVADSRPDPYRWISYIERLEIARRNMIESTYLHIIVIQKRFRGGFFFRETFLTAKSEFLLTSFMDLLGFDAYIMSGRLDKLKKQSRDSSNGASIT